MRDRPEPPTAATELDRDTALEPAEPGRWSGTLTDRWNIGAGANGGYVATFLTRALLGASPMPDPLTMTTHYVARPIPGPLDVTTSVVREGRSHATLTARLDQEHGPVAVALATFGRRRAGGPTFRRGEMPALPPPESCVARPNPGAMSFLDRFEHRFDPGDQPFFAQEGPRDPIAQGWLRLVDRPLDDLAVPLFADAMYPPVFAVFLGGLVPTIELTVHWRSTPHTFWHLGRFESRFLSGGYVEEDGELWGEDGALVAQSRQLSRFSPPEPQPRP